MNTRAQKLEITQFPYRELDDNGFKQYHEDAEGYWRKWKHNAQGQELSFQDSRGIWEKRRYDDQGNLIWMERCNRFGELYWERWEHDDSGNKIRSENSQGQVWVHPLNLEDPPLDKMMAGL